MFSSQLSGQAFATDVMAAQLASKYQPGTCVAGFTVVALPTEESGATENALLADDGSIFGSLRLQRTTPPKGQRWATLEERAAMGDTLSKAMVDSIFEAVSATAGDRAQAAKIGTKPQTSAIKNGNGKPQKWSQEAYERSLRPPAQLG